MSEHAPWHARPTAKGHVVGVGGAWSWALPECPLATTYGPGLSEWSFQNWQWKGHPPRSTLPPVHTELPSALLPKVRHLPEASPRAEVGRVPPQPVLSLPSPNDLTREAPHE